MAKYIWQDPGVKVRIIFGCLALIATLVFIDGLLEGDVLRALAGAVFAWPFATFMIKGVPVPEPQARRAQEEMSNIRSVRPGATSQAFRWSMVLLGGLLGVLAFVGVYIVLSASTETIEAFLPSVARGIRRAEGRDSGMLERLGYAVVFAVAGGAALLTAWKRAWE
jgi:hypothetical protein